MAHEEVFVDLAQIFALRNLSSWLSPSKATLVTGKITTVERRILYNERFKRMMNDALKEM